MCPVKQTVRGPVNRLALKFLTLAALCSCTSSEELITLAESVGQYLIDAAVAGESRSLAGSTESPGIVRIGPGLATKLDDLGSVLSPSCSTQVGIGDATSPIGTGEGTHHVYIWCEGSAVLGIRLKYDGGAERFHILGFWTP